MTSSYAERYQTILRELVATRKASGIRQTELADRLQQEQSFISKVENGERRLDLVELFDWLNALDVPIEQFLSKIGWIRNSQEINTGLPALPIPGKVREVPGGVLQLLDWQGTTKEVLLEGISAAQYLDVEKRICDTYSDLNTEHPKLKNREAICKALELAVDKLPNLNPSDIYHHIVYRLYLREFKKTQADRSWVRAGGEAVELFIENHYNKHLSSHGIRVKWLVNRAAKSQAMRDLGIAGEVTDAKLDIALYGRLPDNTEKIFGGIHAKASLAERVSDDVPCSEIMIAKGFYSYLFTFDAKSFPPPSGDLVNRGELGSIESPSDKRKYVEEHGSFSACFSYNLRTIPSGCSTTSGRKIYTSKFDPETDKLIKHIIEAWRVFSSQL